MKLVFSQPEIKGTLAELNLPEHSYYMRRAARALDIVNQDKVHFLGEDVFRVDSQFDAKFYHVELNHGNPGCSCEDFKKNGVMCKHMIAATIYNKESQANQLTIYDDTANSHLGRGRWIVTDPKARAKFIIYRDGKGNLHCPCNRKDCEHRKAIREYDGGGDGRGRVVENECGSETAKELQRKLNGQSDSQGNNGNGAHQAPSQDNIDKSSIPFLEADAMDTQQFFNGNNGNAHRLSNGEYVISIKGIEKLSEKYGITTKPLKDYPKDGYVTVEAFRPDTKNSCKSTQMYVDGFEIAEAKAKRNSCRMLIPIADIRAVEKKYQLECEFSWEAAYEKCAQIAGGKPQCDIFITELIEKGKLPKKSPSEMNRKDYLILWHEIQDDQSNDGGDDSPSSDQLNECKEVAVNPRRFEWLKSSLENLENDGITDLDLLKRACELDTSLFQREIGEHWTIIKEQNWGGYTEARLNRFWLVTADTAQLREKCFCCGKTKSQVAQLHDDLILWERYQIKTVVCSDCLKATTKADMTERFRDLYNTSPGAINTDGLPKPSEQVIRDISEKLGQIRGGELR